MDVRDGPGGRPLAGLVYDPVLLEATREVLPPDQPLREPEAAALGAPYFARLRQRRDLGRRVTEAYAAFRHGRREREEERMPPVRELLRGADLQHAFVVWETDPGLQAEVQQCLGLRERWERRRALRTLAGRAAAATVTVWPRPGFEPDAVAEEVGPFRFLRPGLYDPDTGLDQDVSHAMRLDDLEEVAQRLHDCWMAGGSGMRDLDRPIGKLGTSARMGLVAAHDLRPGDPVDLDHVTFAFPRRGIGVEHWDEVEGWELVEPVAAGAVIDWPQVRPAGAPPI